MIYGNKIDPSILDIINELNNNGYTTIFSCSGITTDHPYSEDKELLETSISFPFNKLDNDKINKIKQTASMCGFAVKEVRSVLNPFLKIYLPVMDIENKFEYKEELNKRIVMISCQGINVMDELSDGSMIYKKTIVSKIRSELGKVKVIDDKDKIEKLNNFIKLLLEK